MINCVGFPYAGYNYQEATIPKVNLYLLIVSSSLFLFWYCKASLLHFPMCSCL